MCVCVSSIHLQQDGVGGHADGRRVRTPGRAAARGRACIVGWDRREGCVCVRECECRAVLRLVGGRAYIHTYIDGDCVRHR